MFGTRSKSNRDESSTAGIATSESRGEWMTEPFAGVTLTWILGARDTHLGSSTMESHLHL